MSIIIDTDPGVDDALAIMLACCAKLNIVGLTTVYGNSTVENTTQNTLTILGVVGKKIPVYKGARRPLNGKGKLANSHGDNGLGGFKLKKLSQKIEKQNAYQFLVKSLEKNAQSEIICLGPATNLAKVLKTKPELSKKISRLIILGGVIGEKGNISPYAEFNAYNDPWALKILLNAKCSKVLIPINVCRKVYFKEVDFLNLKKRKYKTSLQKITKIYIDYYQNNSEYGVFEGGVMYDLLAVSFLLRPTLFKVRPARVTVCIKGKKTGQTKEANGQSNCSLIYDVDAEKVKELFFSTVNAT